jgi:6-phosphogluconolactonase
MDIMIVANPEDVAEAAADLVETRINEASTVSIGLAGGSTPRSTYEALSKRDIDWSTSTAWMTDERWVPPTDEASNQQMVRESLVTDGHLTFLAPPTASGDPAAAAEAYTKTLLPALERAGDSLALLGIGTDGHTASLFPGTDALSNTSSSYVANHVPNQHMWRLTATFGLLATTNLVVFIVSGPDKADILSLIADGGDYPAARVTAKERVLWLVDEEAAARL